MVYRKCTTVNCNGCGDFTTIRTSVNTAPNNPKPNNGFFHIHLVASVFEEYVHIPSNKTYFLMISERIQKTIIIGFQSNKNGWSTDYSSTVSKLASL